MLIKTKINLKRYIGLSLASTLIACLFTQNFIEAIVVFIIYGATLINQMVLVELVTEMMQNAARGGLRSDGPAVDKSRVLMLTIVKIGVMLGAISFGVLFMGNRIIIPVLNYVIMIFILAASMDRKG
jgi:hypothetical protein